VPGAAYLLGRVAGWGAVGGWMGFVAETVLASLLFGWRWRRGAWRVVQTWTAGSRDTVRAMRGVARELAGVGVGWRPELAADLLRAPDAVDFVEVVADTCLAQPAARREAVAIGARWDVALHGVKLSLGSADGIDADRARGIGALARELDARVVTEHVAFVRGGRREIGHLTPVPRTAEAVRVLAKNVGALRRALPDVPLLLENIAWSFQHPDDAMGEGEFHAAVAAATGCPLLLDLGNLLANATNAGVDPHALLRAYPLERVAMIHVAGGVLEHGFYFDTHAHALPDVELALLAETLQVTGAVPVVLERDDGFPPWAELAHELTRTRCISAASPSARHAAPAPPMDDGALSAGLAAAQAHLAELLTSASLASDVAPYDRVSIARARGVLERKRVDDALPLLPRLRSLGAPAAEVALACVRDTPRAPRRVALSDAMRIAERAEQHDAMRDCARADRLLLRASFSAGKDGVMVPRVGPFVGREDVGGATLWALKGIGHRAAIRLIERPRT
jgi:uncharacterized protein